MARTMQRDYRAQGEKPPHEHHRATPPRLEEAVPDDSTIQFYLPCRKYFETFAFTEGDAKILQSDQWLPSRLVELLLAHEVNSYLDSFPETDVAIIPSETWRAWEESDGKSARVRLPQGHPDLLSFPFIAMPTNVRDSHWFLTIFAHAEDLAVDPSEARTAIIVLDSLNMGRDPRVEGLLQNLLLYLWRQNPMNTSSRDPSSIAVHYPPVLQQPNPVDCGLYPHHFFRVFMQDPDAFYLHCTGACALRGTTERIWDEDRLGVTRSEALFTLKGYAYWERFFKSNQKASTVHT